MEEIDKKIVSNLKVSRFSAPISFVFKNIINIALLGYLYRLGGVGLVGVWAFSLAIVMLTSVLDFGLTNAITLTVSKKGLKSIENLVSMLLVLVSAILGLSTLIACYFLYLGSIYLFSVALIFKAGFLVLAAHWLLAIRMGMHEYYWFSILSAVSVAVQSALVYFISHYLNIASLLTFSVSIFISSLITNAVSYALIKRHIRFKFFESIEELLKEAENAIQYIREFGLESISQRIFVPVTQLSVNHILGAAALGVFNICYRIPTVINQCASEPLRSLLPSLASMSILDDKRKISDILRVSFVIQFTMVLSASIFIYIHTESLLTLWLGAVGPDMLASTKLLLLSMLFESISAPFYWALLSFGYAKSLSFVSFARLFFVSIIGGVVATSYGNIHVFIYVFIFAQVVSAVCYIIYEHKVLNLVKKCFIRIRFRFIFVYFIYIAILNVLLKSLTFHQSTVFEVFLIVMVNVLFVGIPYLSFMKIDLFISPISVKASG